jgi:MFS family permease
MLAPMRRLIALVSSIIFLDSMLFGALTPLVPGYADQFDLSKLQAGLLIGAYGGGALVGGIPGGMLAGRFGPKRAVILGLLALTAASIAFALASGPAALGIARFVQGLASTMTWSGALAWITAEAPRERRGQILGTTFSFAVLGAILGPTFGAVAEHVGIRGAFAAVGGVTFVLAIVATAHPPAAPEAALATGGLRRALADPGFLTGLWLNTLGAFFFGALSLLAPLALSTQGFGAFAIAAVFLTAGLIETAANPLLGRFSDNKGRLVPIRLALVGSTLVAAVLAATDQRWILTVLVCVCGITFGGLFTPGMALISDRSEVVGLSQGLGFGFMNSAWALGQFSGPSVGGALADGLGDAAPYLCCSGLCALTLAVVTTRARRFQTV